jgi:hypothetical protein
MKCFVPLEIMVAPDLRVPGLLRSGIVQFGQEFVDRCREK